MSTSIYQHYKGNRYEVLLIAKDCDTLEDIVVYKTLYENDVSSYWVRTKKDFFADVIVNGVKMPRFRKIDIQ